MSSAATTMTPEQFETLKDSPSRTQKSYWQDRPIAPVNNLVRAASEPHHLGMMFSTYMDRHHLLAYCVSPECDLNEVRDTIAPQLDAIDWQFVTLGWKWESETYGEQLFFGAAPITPVAVEVAYHVTETARVPSIMAEGLMASNPEICHTAFPDTHGRIHLCRTLEGERECAARWMVEIAKKAGTNPRDYSVLEVDMRLVPGARTHQDLHSHSGIVVDRVARIAPEALRLVDQELELPTSASTTEA